MISSDARGLHLSSGLLGLVGAGGISAVLLKEACGHRYCSCGSGSGVVEGREPAGVGLLVQPAASNRRQFSSQVPALRTLTFAISARQSPMFLNGYPQRSTYCMSCQTPTNNLWQHAAGYKGCAVPSIESQPLGVSQAPASHGSVNERAVQCIGMGSSTWTLTLIL